MKTGKPSRRKLAGHGCAEQRCADNCFSVQILDVTLITRVIEELMKLLQGEVNHDYATMEYEVEVIKKELGSWFMEDCELYVGS
jgi:hypothetical protein